jgi:DNA-binding LacI/PurR family transcriptional regulator
LAQSLLNLRPRPDAVIGWEDIASAHLIQALVNLNVNVPEEIRVTGFDCQPLITRLFRPLFPTSKPDFARLGELAVDALARRLDEARVQPRIYYYPVSVLWREPRPLLASDQAVVQRQEQAVEV